MEEEKDIEPQESDSDDIRSRFRRLTQDSESKDKAADPSVRKARPEPHDPDDSIEMRLEKISRDEPPSGLLGDNLSSDTDGEDSSEQETIPPAESSESEITGKVSGHHLTSYEQAWEEAFNAGNDIPIGSPEGGWFGFEEERGNTEPPVFMPPSLPKPEKSEDTDFAGEGLFGETFPPEAEPDIEDTSPSRAIKREEVQAQPLSRKEQLQKKYETRKFPEDEIRSGITPPPPLGETPHIKPPLVDQNGMPLPRRVPEDDLSGTQVTSSAYRDTSGRSRLTRSQSMPVFEPAEPIKKKKKRRKFPRALGCLLQLFGIGLVLILIAGVGAGSYAIFQYNSIKATLPSITNIEDKASQFQTTTITDRDGNVLYEILDPNAGRRTYVTIDEISPYMIAAMISTEDERFFSHPGFSYEAIIRAFLQNVEAGGVASGASTITQQLAKMLLFTQEEAYEISYSRKVKEALLAVALTEEYSKEKILELYLNEVNFGNLAYGVEAASQTYFGVSASQLNLAQSAFLAGIPQAPYVYDVYTNRDQTLERQRTVLSLMYKLSEEKSCIEITTQVAPICIDYDTANEAAYVLEDYEFHNPDITIEYPHWVNYVRMELEELFDTDVIYSSGLIVETTLDPEMQALGEQKVAEQVAKLVENNAFNGALLAMDPQTGEILAMVGSADFYNDDIDGQVNMTISPRQPGSSIKPFTYTAAFEKGWTASTLIWDVPSEFPPSGLENDPADPYIPENYDERFHGPVTVRSALANSYNIPAVKALQFVSVYDDPNTPEADGLVNFVERLGIESLTSDQYGLALTLGGGEVTLLEMTSAYAIYANKGQKLPPVAILKVTDSQGNVLYKHETQQPEQVIDPGYAFLISDILSDNVARTPAFTATSVLNLPFQAAVKTGTTNEYRDNWTIGYTPDLVVGVWVGNADNTAMVDTSGLTGAGPIWSEFMKAAITDYSKVFTPPGNVTEKVICKLSGTEPSQWCDDQTTEYFLVDQPPLGKEDDLYVKQYIDAWTWLEASEECGGQVVEKYVLNISDKWAVKWIEENSQGTAWAEAQGFEKPILLAPERACTINDPRPSLKFESPSNGETITADEIKFKVKVDVPTYFEYYQLQYDLPNDDKGWITLLESDKQQSEAANVYTWEIDESVNGTITVRLKVIGKNKRTQEEWISFIVAVPTQTATPTATTTQTPTITPTFTLTPIVTETPTQTKTPLNTNTPTQTIEPTNTLTPTITEVPTEEETP